MRDTADHYGTIATLDVSYDAASNAYIATLPVTGFLGAIVAHLAQAFGGGWVAARLGTAPMANALVIGLLTAAGAAYNLVFLGGPSWMWIEVPVLIVASAVAGQLGDRR